MNPDQTLNLNHNAAECIKATSKFGSTIYTNICNGNASVVEWGGVDWALSIFLLALGTSIFLGSLLLVAAFIFFIVEELS